MKRIIFTLCIAVIVGCISGYSQERKLIIGIKEAPPFVIKNGETYDGVSIDLWKIIAEDLHYDYEFREYDLGGLLQAIENGDVDLSINPLTVTAERIKKFYFTQPFYVTNLAIAVKAKSGGTFTTIFKGLMSWEFLRIVSAFFLIIVIFGTIVWLLERRRNKDHFNDSIKGIGDGIWWSAVTMTTVGYGDKTPKTILGRIISIIWMFTAIVLISSFTAAIASALTVHNLSSAVKGLEDLQRVSVGSIENSASAEFLKEYGIISHNMKDLGTGLDEVNKEMLQAFVYDEAILRYMVQHLFLEEKILLIPSAYTKEYFSFASSHKDLIHIIDPVLVSKIELPLYSDILNRYGLEYGK